jgi:transcriptional regulator with XRE-family HTH domain
MKLRQVVAKNLRKLRGERGLSQEELADRAGLNRNYVGMIEREENAPTVDTLEDLARALDVSVIDLVRNGPR